MIVYPALDLRDGRVVQWVGGDPQTERISLPDPLAVAARWERAGFAALHVVDLDAALGRGENRRVVTALLASAGVPVQVGGGVRRRTDVEALLAAGASRVVVGTRAVQDGEWLAALAQRHPGRVVLAADCRGGHVLTHGWTAAVAERPEDLLARVAALPLAGVLVTDVDREGRAAGVDAPLFARLARLGGPPLLAAGGIAGGDDLESLRDAGVAGAVVGMALYTGGLDAADIARRFAA